jgi:hypothetical protein
MSSSLILQYEKRLFAPPPFPLGDSVLDGCKVMSQPRPPFVLTTNDDLQSPDESDITSGTADLCHRWVG